MFTRSNISSNTNWGNNKAMFYVLKGITSELTISILSRLENVERIPAVLGEFIQNLKHNDSQDSQASLIESIYTCETNDFRVWMIKGTPLNPPTHIRANIVIAECGVDDEVN